MSRLRKMPPAYGARWNAHREELRQDPDYADARGNLTVYLGWDGQRRAARNLHGLWLPPDRDPDLTDWRLARGTAPLVVVTGLAAPAELEQARAVAHNLVAAGCELVVVVYDSIEGFGWQARAFTP